MHSTQNLKQSDDPHDVFMVSPDVVLVAPTDEELAKLAHTLRHPSNPQTRTGSDLPGGSTVPRVDTTFRATAVRDVQVTGDRPSIGRRAVSLPSLGSPTAMQPNILSRGGRRSSF
jgi:hypothetical protein